jgi:hypothetical protein
MLMYRPENWYWFVGGDETQAFSSATAAFVPAADATFAAWLAAGGVPTPIDTLANLHEVLAQAGVPPFAPVTPLQARKALRAAALMAQVEAAVAAASVETRDAWEYASIWKRYDPFVLEIATAIGLTEAQIDDLFRQAAVL